jgi:hypothetical protein
LRDFVATRESRTPWRAEAELKGGETLDCHIRPIQKGATMVRFALRAPATVPAPAPRAD